MWNVFGSHARFCDGLTRREVLRVGGAGAFGLTLPELLRSQRTAAATRDASSAVRSATRGRAKNCIVLFLMGGPSQHSTWDPKPERAGRNPRRIRADLDVACRDCN